MTPITEQSLIEAGYKKTIFFFQVGGGEDEDDRFIYVKDGIAVTYEGSYQSWHARKEDDINYVNGFDTDCAVTLKYIEEITSVVL